MLAIFVCSKCKKPPLPNEVVSISPYPICRACYNKEEQLTRQLDCFEAPDNIVENLWLGSCYSDIDSLYLKSKNIAGIVLACPEGIERFPEEFKYHKLEICDTLDADLLSHLEPALTFIASIISTGKGVLVRCAAGVSRSPAVIIAYLMKHYKWDYDKAFGYVLNKRPLIDINCNFAEQLRKYWEKIV